MKKLSVVLVALIIGMLSIDPPARQLSIDPPAIEESIDPPAIEI